MNPKWTLKSCVQCDQNGAERVPGLPKWSPKATKIYPKGSQNGPGDLQKPPLRKSTDLARHKWYFWSALGSHFGPKTMKNRFENRCKTRYQKSEEHVAEKVLKLDQNEVQKHPESYKKLVFPKSVVFTGI